MSDSMDLQDAETKRKTITVPELRRRVFDDFRRGRRVHRIARSQRVDRAEIEAIVVEGIRAMEAAGAKLPTFRESVNGFGKPMNRSVVSMPSRVEGRAA